MALEEAKNRESWVSLLSFYSNPENQKIRRDILELALEGPKNEEMWLFLLSFYSNPENQKIRPDILELTLEGAKNRELWPSLLSFYSSPEIRKLDYPELDFILKFILKSIERIADKNLRNEINLQYQSFLKNPEAPFSLFLLSSSDKLPLLVTAFNLGLRPEVVLSWSLNNEEIETLLPIFVKLEKSGIRFNFPFIFYPREGKKHNKLLIDYFQKLSFLSGLPQELSGNLIKKHFQNLNGLINKYKIEQETRELPFSFLVKIVRELQNIEKELVFLIRKTFSLPSEITDREILTFLKEYQYINTILTLRNHYKKIYSEGLPLLNEVVASLIKGKFFEERYNLNNEIVQNQLAPLIKGFPLEKQQEIISLWRGNYFHISILETKTEITTEKPDSFQGIIEHLKAQVIKEGHYLGILDLLQGLSEDDKNFIKDQILQALEGKTINLKELREILKDIIPQEKVNIISGIIQLFRDLSGGKTPEELLKSLNKLKENVNKYWQELETKVIWETDIVRYLENQLLSLKSKEGKESKLKILIQLNYFTDHPRTLFEIGAYPVSTCQDYRSTGNLNRHLLGYVFDAHIKALVQREIYLETDVELREDELNQSQIKLDENGEEIKIILPSGKEIKGKVSKPVARRIVFLGEKNGNPVLLLEPIYTQSGRTTKEDEKLNTPLYKLQKALLEKGINVEIRISPEGINIGQSRNPASYYRDR